MATQKNLKQEHPHRNNLHPQPLAQVSAQSILSHNPLQLSATLYMCRTFLRWSYLKVILYSQRPGWSCVFNKGTISYWQHFILDRSDRWYHEKISSLESDKYLNLTQDDDGNVVVARTQEDPSQSYELMTVPLSAFTKEGCALPHLLMLAILRSCLSNKLPPWSRKKFMRYFRVDLSTIKRYLRFLIGQGLVAPYTWKKYKPFQEEEDCSDQEYFSAKNVYSINNKPKYLYRYKATKKAVININDWPLLSENDKCALLCEGATTGKNLISPESFGNFCPPILIKASPIGKMDFIEGSASDEPQALRSRDPIFSQVMEILTSLSTKGYFFGERWRQQQETYRAARWLAHQEGVTEDKLLAWERELATSSFLKSVLRHGWKHTLEIEYAKKGGSLWNKSAHLGKYEGKQWRAKHLIYHFNDIIAGRYARKDLSDKAKDRVWDEDNTDAARNTPVKRTEVPTEWFKEWLIGKTDQEDLRALLERLWVFLGGATYENLIDPCDYVMNEQSEWVFMAPNRFHAELMDEKLGIAKKTTAYREGNYKSHAKLREAYNAWLKENANNVEVEQKDGSIERDDKISTTKGKKDMGIVPANDDEGVIPAYVDDDAPHESGQIPPHMGGRAKSQNLEAHGRESEEALLRMKKERQERMLRDVRECTNTHRSERALRAHTIEQHGISAYQCWFDKCKVGITDGAARYVAPNDFIAVEVERRYGMILEDYAANGDEIRLKRKKEKM